MVNSPKQLVTFILTASSVCSLLANVSPPPENLEVSRKYQEICEQLYISVSNRLYSENAKIQFDLGTRRAIKLIGHIRCRDARVLLLDNLGYTPWQPKGMETTCPFTNFNYLAFISGERASIQGQYPAFEALLRIGVPFADFSVDLGRFGGYGCMDALSMMGLNCGGQYYFHFAKGIFGKTAQFFPYVYVRSPYALPQQVRKISSSNGLGVEDVFNIYNNMEAILLRRFSEELKASSQTLPDTISTMGFIRSLDAIPILADNLTICPQASTNAPGGFVFPAAEALIEIGPAIGDCFARLKATKPLSVEEALWLRISHELYPEGLEYELYCAAQTNDLRAARLMQSLPWHRLTEEDMKDP